MANPSSSHHRDSRERERDRHHHHRTISSTTLLLVLSLILAVLAVMLSLPSNRMPPIASPPSTNNPNPNSAEVPPPNEQAHGFWTYLSPRRSQALVAREHDVAIREAEVAKREADLLAGAYAGVPPPVVSCPPCSTVFAAPSPPPPETIIKEVVREVETIGGPRSATEIRMEDVMQREEKVSEREKQVGSREEIVGKRESDASRRENWIMEQLIALGNDPAPIALEREEFVYDVPKSRKVIPLIPEPSPTRSFANDHPSETIMIDPAHTRRAARPAPEQFIASPSFAPGAATTAVEYVQEISEEPSRRTVVVDRSRPTLRPRRSFWDW